MIILLSTEEEVVVSEGIAIRSSWRIDNEIPIFVEEGRNYIEKLI